MQAVALLFGLSAIIAALLHCLRVPVIVGFLVAGLLVRSFGVEWHNADYLVTLAEFGAAFLLFSVGLELKVKHFKDLGWTIVWVSLLQMLLVFFLSYGMFLIFGYFWKAAVVLSMIISFSSTILVAMVLKQRDEIHSLHGKLMMGILLMQDLVVVVVLFVIPYLTGGQVDYLSLTQRVLLNILAVVLLVVVGSWFFGRIKKIFDREYNVVFLLAVAYLLGVIYFFSWEAINLPPEIAGLVAGLSLSGVLARTRITNWFDPLRDFFLVFLFFCIGTEVDLLSVFDHLDKLLILIVMVLLSKMAIGWLAVGIGGFPRKVIFLSGLGLANMSELGLVILPMSLRLGLITEEYLALYSMLILISLIISAIILKNCDDVCFGVSHIFGLLEKTRLYKLPPKESYFLGKKVLLGCHRSGWSIVNSLSNHNNLVVVDYDVEQVKRLRKKGVEAYYGDVQETRFLLEHDICQAKMVISTIPHFQANMILIDLLRNNCKGNKSLWVACLAKTRRDVAKLYKAGYNLVLNPHMSVAIDMASLMLSTRRNVSVGKIKKMQKKLLKI
ncbi:cation:proton antiporter [Patescibacteria group bacterium]|nr:cation:proton antiporter [Patescibacteria group bacterium]